LKGHHYQTTSGGKMKNMNRKLGTMILCAAVVSLSAIAALAQTQRPAFDPLRGLKHALETASAPALSSQQEEQLKTLVQQFRDSRKSKEPDATLGAARKAYQEAILAGDAATANAQAQTIANLAAAHSSENLKAEAGFAIQALTVIKGNQPQYDALVQKYGNSGVTQLVSGIAGGGRFGGPGRGPGFSPRGKRGERGDGAGVRPNRFEGGPRGRRP
jgi:hypothetical protein